jgi:transposase
VHLDRLVAQVAPGLVSSPGIGADHAATLLIEASSGKVVRHRLNRGGNREANRALYMICLARMRRDRRTQEYVARRTAGEAWQE